MNTYNHFKTGVESSYIPYIQLDVEQKYYSDSPKFNDRCWAAVNKWGLDKLVYDSDAAVRCKVIEQGYGFDILENDPSIKVQEAIACQMAL